MKLIQKSIAMLLTICMLYSLVPVDFMPPVLANNVLGDTSGRITNAGQSNSDGGILEVGLTEPVFRITLNREKETFLNGTPEQKQIVINNHSTYYPNARDYAGQCLYFWSTNLQNSASVKKFSRAIAKYEKSNRTLSWYAGPSYTSRNIDLNRSGAAINPFKAKVMEAYNNKTIRDINNLSNLEWLNYLPTYDEALQIVSYIFTKNGGTYSVNEKIKTIVDSNFDKDVNTLSDKEKFSVSAGYGGLLVSLYVVSKQDPNRESISNNYSTAIDDYFSNANTVEKPVSLVIDTAVPMVSHSSKVVYSIPTIDYIEMASIVDSTFSLSSDRKVAGNIYKGFGGNTRELIKAMANESIKKTPYSMTYASNGKGVMRLSDIDWSKSTYQDTMKRTPLGWAINIPYFDRERVVTGKTEAYTKRTEHEGYLDWITFDNQLKGFMIVGNHIANPYPSVSYYVEDTVLASTDFCSPETRVTAPPRIIFKLVGDSSLISSLSSRKDDPNFKGIKIESEIYRREYLNSFEAPQGPQVRMPALELQLNTTLTGEDLVSKLQGNPFILNDLEVLGKTYLKDENGSQSYLYLYDISINLTIDNEKYVMKSENIVLRENGKPSNYAEVNVPTLRRDIQEAEDIVITKPSSTTTTDIVNPSENENLAQNTQMLKRYEFTSKGDNFSEVKNNEPLKEEYEVMGGVPSSEELYFSVGGSEFKVAMIMQYWMNEHSRDRTYTMYFDGTDCEYNNIIESKGDTWKGDKIVSEPPASTGSTISSNLNLTHTGGTITVTWTGTTKWTGKSEAAGCHGWTLVNTWDDSNYDNAVAAANTYSATLNSVIQAKWKSASDLELREFNFASPNASVNITSSNPHIPGSGSGGSHAVPPSKDSSGSPEVPGSGSPGADNTYTVTLTATMPPHAICGPCCGHKLPKLYDTWKQGLVYDFAKISQIRLYKLDQGSVKGMEELVGTDEIFASVISGNPTYFMNMAQMTEKKRPILPAKMDISTPEIPYEGLTASAMENSGITYFSGDNRSVSQSSRDGRLRYILDPSFTQDTISFTEQGNGTGGSFTIDYNKVAAPEQHDDVIYKIGQRTKNCDGMATTNNFSKSSSNNVKPMDKVGHINKWADGSLYTNIQNTTDYSNYWDIGSYGNSYVPLELTANDNAALGTGSVKYYEDYNHHIRRNGLVDKLGYSDKADQRDIETAEWKSFDKTRRTKVIANIISDFLILQTSGGDQSIFYYEKASPATEAQEHFQKVKITTQELFNDNPLSIFTGSLSCDGPVFKNSNVVDSIVVGGYNGQYNKPAQKYQPYSLITNEFLPFSGVGKVYDANKHTGVYQYWGGSQITTLLDKDPAKTISRPIRGVKDQDSSFKVLQKGIQILPTTLNQLYEPYDTRVWYSQDIGYYSLDERVKDIESNRNRVGCNSNVQIGLPQRVQFGDAYKIKWGNLFGVEYNTKYFLTPEGDSNASSVNSVVVYTPVSTEDALVLKQEDLSVNGMQISRDQRTNKFDFPNMNDLVNKLKVCPLDPALCEYRYLDCKFLHDTVLADFDFSSTYTVDEKAFVDGEHITQTVTKKNTYTDNGKWITTNKITGIEYILPSGFSVENNNKVGSGSYLSANGSRWSIPFGDLGLSNTKANRLSVEMDLTVESNSNNLMLISFYNYGITLKPNRTLESFISRSSLDTTKIGSRADINSTTVLNRVNLKLTFGFNNIVECQAIVNGVPVSATVSELRNVWETVNGVRALQLKQETIKDKDTDSPKNLSIGDIGTNLNIGSWGSSNAYTANYYVDNLKVVLKGGTNTHNSTCYEKITVHATKRTHVHDNKCYLDKDIYTCNGEPNSNYQLGCGLTDAYTCNNLPLNTGKSEVTYYEWACSYVNCCHGAGTSGYFISGHYPDGNELCRSNHHNGADLTGKSEVRNEGSFKSHKHTDSCRHNHVGTVGTDTANGCYTTPTVHKHNMSVQNITCGIPVGGTGTVYNYSYIGGMQQVNLPAGRYKLETWGAQGGMGWQNQGKYGHYAYGEITLTTSTTLYLYVGGAGGKKSYGGYNGGGTGYDGGGEGSGGGGGATDIRMNGNALGNRVIVAGGGGGGGHGSYNTGIGGSGVLGEGGAGGSHDRGGGGGGYYGGAAGHSTDIDGQDGSSYVGGVVSGSSSIGNNSGNGKVKITNLDHKHGSSCYTSTSTTCPKLPIGSLACTGELNTTTDFNKHVHTKECLTTYSNLDTKMFLYTGDVQTYVVPWTDEYTLETYGPSVGNKAGYAKGTVKLEAGTILYISVANQGGYNSSFTDIRTKSKPNGLPTPGDDLIWNEISKDSNNSRLLIAGSTLGSVSVNNVNGFILSGITKSLTGNDGNGRVIITPKNSKPTPILLDNIVNGVIKPEDAKDYLGADIFNQIMKDSEKVLHTWSGWSSANDKGFKVLSGYNPLQIVSGNLVSSINASTIEFTVDVDISDARAIKEIRVTLDNNTSSPTFGLFRNRNRTDDIFVEMKPNTTNQVISIKPNWLGAITSLEFDTSAAYSPGNTIVKKIEIIGYGTKTASGEASYVNNEKVIASAGTVWNFVGGTSTTKILNKGKYKFEVYGSQGSYGTGGLGGYSYGDITLTSDKTLYINVGNTSGYNGGGLSKTPGGGATDIRLGATSLNDRIIVAGGGGGSGPAAGGSGGGGNSVGLIGSKNCGTPGSGGTLSSGGLGGSNCGTAGTFGQGGIGTCIYGYSGNGQAGGGGGYFGGGGGGHDCTRYNDNDDSGGGGGSGYVNTSLFTNIGGITGNKGGDGFAKITALEDIKTGEITYSFIPLKITYVNPFSGMKQTIIDNFGKIPEKLPNGSPNPIWLCKNQGFNTHVCESVDNLGNTVTLCTTYSLFNCSEPHHRGEHYSGTNKVCWSACKDDDKHVNTKNEVVTEQGKGDTVYLADFLQLDSAFTVYFPNVGHFYGNGALGLASPQTTRGKGYTQNMDTTQWTREKRVKFPFDVIFDDTIHIGGTWIDLDVPTEYFNFYLLVSNDEASNAQVEFEVEAINCNTGTGVNVNPNLSYSNSITTDYANALNTFKTSYVNLLLKYVLNGYKINFANSKGANTAPNTNPFGSYGYDDFYIDKQGSIENNLRNTIKKISNQIESDFEGGTSNGTINPHTQSTRGINNTVKPITSNDNYIRVDNKLRENSFESLHGGYKGFYLDVVGRVGNFAISDTEDFRFSNFFKTPIISAGDTVGLSDPNNWLVEGLVLKVDDAIQNYYIGDLFDIRGNAASPDTRWLDTYGTESWMSGLLTGSGRNVNNPNLVSQVLAGDVNNINVLKNEELRFGYDAYTTLVTIGTYQTGNIQVIPKYYALKLTDNRVSNVPDKYNVGKGTYIPLDVYINKDGLYSPVNVYGNASNGNPNIGKLGLYDYIFNLDWTDESNRRNYTLEERARTLRVCEFFKTIIYQYPDDAVVGDIDTSTLPIEKIIDYISPKGKNNLLGTSQYILMDSKHRTFMGNSSSYGNNVYISNGGTTDFGINKNKNAVIDEIYFDRSAQRWHGKLGVPSSSVFVPTGVSVDTDSVKYVMNSDFAIICTAETIAIGDVWTLYYSQPWFSSLRINGESYTTAKHYPGHRLIDANKNSVECPDCLPPIISVYSSNKSSIEDIEIINTH